MKEVKQKKRIKDRRSVISGRMESDCFSREVQYEQRSKEL